MPVHAVLQSRPGVQGVSGTEEFDGEGRACRHIAHLKRGQRELKDNAGALRESSWVPLPLFHVSKSIHQLLWGNKNYYTMDHASISKACVVIFVAAKAMNQSIGWTLELGRPR